MKVPAVSTPRHTTTIEPGHFYIHGPTYANQDLNVEGKVGVNIGTATPKSSLSVSGGVAVSNNADQAINAGNLYVQGKLGIGVANPSENLKIQTDDKSGPTLILTSSAWAAGVTGGTLQFGDNNHSIKAVHSTGMTVHDVNEIKIDTPATNVTGKLGVNTSSSPKSSLSVNGGLAVTNNADAAIGAGNLYVQGSVGIGILSPSKNLEIQTDDSAGPTLFLTSTKWGAGTTGGTLQFGDSGHYIKAAWGSGMTIFDHDAVLIKSTYGAVTIDSERETVTINSKTGVYINTSNPTTTNTYKSGYAVYDTKTYSKDTTITSTQTPALTVNNDILCSTYVWSTRFCCTSDARCKQVHGKSNSQDDLNILNQLEVTDYSYIDPIGDEGPHHKKLIGQQVKQVYPDAVTQRSEVVPDVYQMAESFFYDPENRRLTVYLAKSHGLNTGDDVTIYLTDGERKIEIESVPDKHCFTAITDHVDTGSPFEDLFVYGRLVPDMLSIDYDAISMLNVSATQELYRQIRRMDKEIKALHTENDKLQSHK